jgi:hypothetical protein
MSFADEFPAKEQPALAKLHTLLDDWRKQLARYTVWDEGTQKHWPANECFCGWFLSLLLPTKPKDSVYRAGSG